VLLQFVAGIMLCLSLVAGAQATQVCGWLVETTQPDNVHDFALWLRADGRMEFFYRIGGEGVFTASSKAHAPNSGTFSLNPGKDSKVWGFKTSLNPPGKIDISIALHQMPKDIFSNAPTPVLAKFSFQRNVPESEKKAPPTLAQKQCVVAK